MGDGERDPPLLEYNVEHGWTEYKKYYKKKISQLRRGISNETRELLIRGKRYGRKLLLKQEPDTLLTSKDVVLKTNNGATITLQVARENLYVIGYGDGNGDGYAFDSKDISIPNATKLDYNGSYPSLEAYAGKNRSEIDLGPQALKNAVIFLAARPEERANYEAGRAKSLIVIIQMISEAARFESILDHLASLSPWGHSKTYRPPTWVRALENEWSALSKALLRIHCDSSNVFAPIRLQDEPPESIKDVTDAIRQVAVLKLET